MYLKILSDFSKSITNANTVEDLYWRIINNCISKLNFEDCVIYIFDPNENVLIQKAAYGDKRKNDTEINNAITIELGKGIVGTVAETFTSEIINDLAKDKRYIIDDKRRKSEITVPILAYNKLIGIIDSEHSELDFFKDEHLHILKTIANIAGIKIEDLIIQEKLLKHNEDLENKVTLKTIALNNAIEKLTESNEQIKQFSYYISHDLKEPLRNLQSFLGLIEKKIEQKEYDKIDEFLDFVLSSSSRMTNMINEVYNFSVLTDRKSNMSEISVSDLVNEVKFELNNFIQKHNATILVHNDLIFRSSRSMLYVVLQNLIKNAINYCDKENPKIEISVEEINDKIKFELKDNGCGVVKEDQEIIFELFKRIAKGKTKGSGIGLATCKKIIQHLNGDIWVESDGLNGSTFLFTIQNEAHVVKEEKHIENAALVHKSIQ